MKTIKIKSFHFLSEALIERERQATLEKEEEERKTIRNNRNTKIEELIDIDGNESE